ncbi:MAG: hypothetical protein JXJ04_22220 [Spirochaetales bacterium]|nr:hypothetical protein [Spirochaetales bacterium]
MNKIFILFIICVLLMTTVTCTYFDPFAAAGYSSLFWVDVNKEISRMPADKPDELRDFQLEPFPKDFWEVTVMAMDPVMGRMYLSILGDNTFGICRANYNGTDAEMVVISDQPVNGISIDFYQREIYWSEATLIHKARIDEFDKATVVSDTGIIITDLEIDMVSNTLYFVDGSDSVHLMATTGELFPSIALAPAGAMATKIELSLFDNKIYWFNLADQSIYHSDAYNGGNEVMLSPPNLPGLIDFSLDLETGYMYWADMSGVYRVRTNDTLSVEYLIDRIDLIQFAGDFMNAWQY